MRLTRVLPVLAAALLAFTACGSSDDDDETQEQTGGTIQDTLAQDVDTLLPMDSNVGDNISVLEVVYSGLVRYDTETTEPYNYVAEDITTEDNLVWTIKIKSGWQFHNGEDVDADAFARSWNYAAYGPNGMANNYFFDKIEGYEAMQGEWEEDDNGEVTVVAEPAAEELSGLKVVDPLTLEVTLTTPFAGFSQLLGYTGFFPIAQECLDDIEQCAVQPIGNGPFEVEEWDQGVSLTANRWADYPGDDVPGYDRIEWTEYSGDSSWPDFQAGNVDFSAPPAPEFESALNDPEYNERVVERAGVALTYIGFPLYLGEPWDNPDFRKAISLAIDVETIVDTLLPGQEVVATSWVPEGPILGGTTGTCEFCAYDPDEAQRLLDKAGGWPEGKKLTITFGADPTSQEYFKAIGDQIKKNLGIDYVLDPADDFFAKRSDRNMEGIFRNNWFADYPLNENYLRPVYGNGSPEEGNTNFGYYNQEFMDKLAAGDQAATIDEAVALYQEAELVLAEDFPTIPLSLSNNVTFYSTNVDNVKLDPFSGAVKLREISYIG